MDLRVHPMTDATRMPKTKPSSFNGLAREPCARPAAPVVPALRPGRI
jgi:hypothetical protein